jgi:hypothetical protein
MSIQNVVPAPRKNKSQTEAKLIGNDNDGLIPEQMSSRPVAFRWVTEKQLADIRFYKIYKIPQISKNLTRSLSGNI